MQHHGYICLESETGLKIIVAAEAVGAQRSSPSEYGTDMYGKATPKYVTMLEGREKVFRNLKEHSKANMNFTWTAVVPRSFFNYPS
jgi:hypothetical protein